MSFEWPLIGWRQVFARGKENAGAATSTTTSFPQQLSSHSPSPQARPSLQSASFFCRVSVLDLLSAFTMFRAAVVRSLRATAPRAIRVPVSRQLRSSPAVRPSQFVPCFQCQSIRRYSAPAGLSKEEVEGRIINLLKNFDKVRGRWCVLLFLSGFVETDGIDELRTGFRS